MLKERCQTGDRISNVKTQLCPRSYLPADYRIRGRVCCSKHEVPTVTTKPKPKPKPKPVKGETTKAKCPKGQRVASVAGTCPKGFERSRDVANGRACCHPTAGGAQGHRSPKKKSPERVVRDEVTQEVVAEVKNDMLDFVQESIRPEHQQKLSIIGLATQQLQNKTTMGILGEWSGDVSPYMKVHLEALGVSEDQLQGWFLEFVDFVTFMDQLLTNKVALSPAATATLEKYMKQLPQFEDASATLYMQLDKLAPSRFDLRTYMNKFIKLRAQMTKLERQFMSEVEVYSRTTSFVTGVTLGAVLSGLLNVLLQYVNLVNSKSTSEETWSWIKMNTEEGTVRDILGVFFRHRTDASEQLQTLAKYQKLIWNNALKIETLEDAGYIEEGWVYRLTSNYTRNLHQNVLNVIMWPLKYAGLDSTTLLGISTVLLALYLLKTRGWPLVRSALSSFNVQEWWDIRKIRQDITQPVRGFRCSPRHICVPVYSLGSKQVEYKNLDACASRCHILHGGYVDTNGEDNKYLGISSSGNFTFQFDVSG